MERLPPPPDDGSSSTPADFGAPRPNAAAPGAAAARAPVGEMPLFPLNTVLFPNMPLPLHIFEERYKTMVARCLEESRPFGIVLLTDGAAEAEANAGPAAARRVRTRAVGCAARIAHVERLADGRMNILVVGEQRFRILDTHEREPYRTGITVAFDDDPAPDTDGCLGVLADEVGRLLKDFLTRSLALAGKSMETLDLPAEPEPLSFTTACVLPLDLDEKQRLLETTDTAARLSFERDILLREVAKLRRAEAARSPEPITASRFAPYRSRN